MRGILGGLSVVIDAIENSTASSSGMTVKNDELT